MKERPILFSGPMVSAILSGRKTQTRRVVKIPGVMPRTAYVITSPDEEIIRFDDGTFHYLSTAAMSGPYPCPYGKPGDRLWVRETWRFTGGTLEESRALTEDIMSGSAVDYKATYVSDMMEDGANREDSEMACDFEDWRSPIHMPRWACRLLLEITDVRVERLNDISEADCCAEGCGSPITRDCKKPKFEVLWDSINAKRVPWSSNPWVWALTFKRIEA